jgi:hypothetical protein
MKNQVKLSRIRQIDTINLGASGCIGTKMVKIFEARVLKGLLIEPKISDMNANSLRS